MSHLADAPLYACVQPEGSISHEGFLWKRAAFKFQASPHTGPACPRSPTPP